jgi:hypothetical protein
MNGLARKETSFVAALLDSALPVPEGVTSRPGSNPKRRFSVYRNNVSSALIEAVAARYPVMNRLVGEDFFRAMTREYVLGHLPASPVLIGYGRDFPDFVSKFPPAAGLLYLADVARLESAYWEAYHAADAQPLDAAAFTAIAPERLASIRMEFIPSFFLITSTFPIVSIWHTNVHDAEVKPVDLSAGEDAAVARPELDVEIRRLPPGAAKFLETLKISHTLGDAAVAGAAAEAGFDLAHNLRGLIETRIVARFL